MSDPTNIKNFLYTKGYVKSRLIKAGFSIKLLPMRYGQKDRRYWSALVNQAGGEEHNLILTCLKDGITDKRGTFSVMGPKFFSVIIDTRSADVLIERLKELCEPGPGHCTQ